VAVPTWPRAADRMAQRAPRRLRRCAGRS